MGSSPRNDFFDKCRFGFEKYEKDIDELQEGMRAATIAFASNRRRCAKSKISLYLNTEPQA
jgi:hypothetical protein